MTESKSPTQSPSADRMDLDDREEGELSNEEQELSHESRPSYSSRHSGKDYLLLNCTVSESTFGLPSGILLADRTQKIDENQAFLNRQTTLPELESSIIVV